MVTELEIHDSHTVFVNVETFVKLGHLQQIENWKLKNEIGIHFPENDRNLFSLCHSLNYKLKKKISLFRKLQTWEFCYITEDNYTGSIA